MKIKHLFWLTGSALSVAAFAAPALAQSDDASQLQDIIVTGSRIQRAGFDAPTPTVVIGAEELGVGNRPSIAASLNDNPQFRASSTPATSTANTNSAEQPVDMRGLGSDRTLTLLDGHRFMGSNDLNTIPQSIVKRVDVVTGGASAAWGSSAVAGVVNIILDDKMTGWKMGTDSGISTRGDGVRNGANLAWGTNFAGDLGHVMIAGDYLDDQGAFDRSSRPNLAAGLFQDASGRLILAPNVNSTLFNRNGSILNLSAQPYNLIFNHDGSVGPLPLGSQTFGSQTVGGNGQELSDYLGVSAPYKKLNLFGRSSYDLTGSLKLWADMSYSQVTSKFGLFPNLGISVIQPDNAFLTSTGKQQLAAAGVTTPFLLGSYLDDVGPARLLAYRYDRRLIEGSTGFDGTIGENWSYRAYYDHGEFRNDESLGNQAISAKYNNAVDSVLVGGQAVCRINAVTKTDPSCVPLNIIGTGNITDAARAYAFGTSGALVTTKLDTGGFSFSGHPFSSWAGAVDIASGADFRREQYITNHTDPISAANGFSILNYQVTNGAFSVREFFGEGNVPLLNIADTAKLDLNGAIRESDYSTSGGALTWKYGGTLRLINDVLLRTVYSRDIRSPSILELFSPRSTGLGSVSDPYRGNAIASNVLTYLGGNPNLKPEVSHTLTIGGSYSPHYIHGLQLSVDYYRINIDGVISSISTQDTLNICHQTSPNDDLCGGVITRDAQGNIATISETNRNLAFYKTDGLDINTSYQLPVQSGALTFRVRGTRVFALQVNNGVTTTDVAGVVGDGTAFGTPKWRVNGDADYGNDRYGVNLRVRHLGGGIYSQRLGANGMGIVNNDIASRTYVDLGARVKAGAFEIFANVNNLLDRDPPLTYYSSPIYDSMGRYFSGGVNLRF